MYTLTKDKLPPSGKVVELADGEGAGPGYYDGEYFRWCSSHSIGKNVYRWKEIEA